MSLKALLARVKKAMRPLREESDDPFEARYYEALLDLRNNINHIAAQTRRMEEARQMYMATRSGFRYMHSPAMSAEIRDLCMQINALHSYKTHVEARGWYLYLVETYFRGDAMDRWEVIEDVYHLAEKLGRKDSVGPWDVPFISNENVRAMLRLVSHQRPVSIVDTLRETLQALHNYQSRVNQRAA